MSRIQIKRYAIIALSLLGLFIVVQLLYSDSPPTPNTSSSTNSSSLSPATSFVRTNPPTPKRPVECTLDYINTEKVSQDDECLLKIIRTQFIYPPSAKPLKLTSPHVRSNSVGGQTGKVMGYLHNKTKGFYIETGAFDGEVFSNTLELERFYGWQGVLIEPIPKQWQKILLKNRHAWVVAAGLSSSPYPEKLRFQAQHLLSKVVDKDAKNDTRHPVIEIQCFPLYSILLALRMENTHFDYFSLDVEGAEYGILKSTPWDKLHVKVLTVEYGRNADPTQPDSLRKFMESQGFEVAEILTRYSNEFLFIRD